MNRKFRVPVLACLSTALIATACSSGSASSATTSKPAKQATKSQPAKQATKSPITIGTISDDAGNGFDEPQTADAVVAWAKWTNSHGGLGGHSVIVDRCNAQGSAATTTQCADQQMADTSIVASTGFAAYAPAAQDPQFQAAGLSWISAYPVNAQDYSQSTLASVPGGVASYMEVPAYAVKHGLKKVAIIRLAIPTLSAVVQQVKTATEASGGQLVADISVPLTEADFTSSLIQAKADGAQIVMLAMQIPQTIRTVQQAASVGYTGAFGLPVSTTPDEATALMAAAAHNRIYSTADLPDAKKSSKLATYRSAMTAAGYSANIPSELATDGWAAAEVIGAAITAVGPDKANRQNVNEYLTHQQVNGLSIYSGSVGRANAPSVSFQSLAYAKTYNTQFKTSGLVYTSGLTDISSLVKKLPPAA